MAPLCFGSFPAHAYKILAVVQGYKEDSAKVLVNGQHVDTPGGWPTLTS